jgi:hypothetical protein
MAAAIANRYARARPAATLRRMNIAIAPEQHRAAKLIGAAYLLAMATSIFGEIAVRGQLIDASDAMATARNIMAHPTLFRAGLIADLCTLMLDLVLIASLYVVLSPVNRYLAQFALQVRVVETALAASLSAYSLSVARTLGGANYLDAFNAEQLAALARLDIGTRGAAHYVVFAFLGLGSAVFAWLWHQSRLVPGVLAWLGVVASLLLMLGSMVILFLPHWGPLVGMTYMIPMFFFEVGLGGWLLIKGLRAPTQRDAQLNPTGAT